MMKYSRLYNSRLYICLAGCLAFSCFQKVSAQVDVRLRELGMENIRTALTESGSVTAFEDRVYRSSYSGFGKAVRAALSGQKDGEIRLVVTDRNGMPQVCVGIDSTLVRRFHSGELSFRDVVAAMDISASADSELKALKGKKTGARSAWRPDFVVYPSLFLENTSLDKFFRYAVALAPAIEMPMWKGAELTAQVIIPVVTNQKGELKTVRPGFVTLKQDFYLWRNWYATLTGGLFDNHRMGGRGEVMWRSNNGRWEAGARVGATVYSIFDNEGWTITTTPKIDAAVYGRVYVPRFNTEVYAAVKRFVYGDYGVSGELVRHFGENTIGLFGAYTKGLKSVGFKFAIPLPGKKYDRWAGIRIKPADYFAFGYSMAYTGYFDTNRAGRDYSVSTDSYRSKGFYQPEYLRYFLLKELDSAK